MEVLVEKKTTYNQVSKEFIDECGANPIPRGKQVVYSLIAVQEILDDKGRFHKLFPRNVYIPETQVIFDPYANDGAGAEITIALTRDHQNTELNHDFYMDRARFQEISACRIILSGDNPEDNKLHFVLALGNGRKDRPKSSTPIGGYVYKMESPKKDRAQLMKIESERFSFDKMIREPLDGETKDKHELRLEGWLQALLLVYAPEDSIEEKQYTLINYIKNPEGLGKFKIIAGEKTKALLKLVQNSEGLRVIHFDYNGSGWVLSSDPGRGAFSKVSSHQERYTELVMFLLTPHGESYQEMFRNAMKASLE